MKQATFDRILGDEPTLIHCGADGCRFEAVTEMTGECGCLVPLCHKHRDQHWDRPYGRCVVCGELRLVTMFRPLWAEAVAA